MSYNIDWIIQYGMKEDNANAAAIFDDMEKYVQKCKLKLQEMILLEKNQGKKQANQNLLPLMERKKPEPQLKGYASQFSSVTTDQ